MQHFGSLAMGRRSPLGGSVKHAQMPTINQSVSNSVISQSAADLEIEGDQFPCHSVLQHTIQRHILVACWLACVVGLRQEVGALEADFVKLLLLPLIRISTDRPKVHAECSELHSSAVNCDKCDMTRDHQWPPQINEIEVKKREI